MKKRFLLASLMAGLFSLAGNLVAQPAVFVTTSDLQSGSTALLPSGADEVEINQLLIHADAAATYYEGRIYVVGRLGEDSILVLDPEAIDVPVLQFSVGNGTNPQAIAFASPTRAYVSRFASTRLLIVNPADGTELGEIDLSAFADADGLPEMGPMVVVDDRLYVACPRLDANNNWTPAAIGYLAVIDMDTDALIDMDETWRECRESNCA